ncbi:hypothetical protein GCM10010401_06090 [Rarobacter faecitabidus]|uniref:Uncharacterized protein n=1 Tax=Rarobacter faecitabidus TaxID=13243 RepID=A0A542ZTN7_RARFA|nr:hypothetical protein [Rarobacter faecitabidus]TQL63639.1 hypothetical protein FB461_0106 [Rarobacter faecitabidus]
MRSIVRGVAWALILGGIVGQLWGPDDLTFVPHLVIGIALVFAAANRRRREETDYTAVMLQNAGYGDPDAKLPTGVQAASTRRNHPGLAFLAWLIVLALILWPIRTSLVDRVKDATGAETFSQIFDDEPSDGATHNVDYYFDDPDEVEPIEDGASATVTIPGALEVDPVLGLLSAGLPDVVIASLVGLSDASAVSQVQLAALSASIFPSGEDDSGDSVDYAYAYLSGGGTTAGDRIELGLTRGRLSTATHAFDPEVIDGDVVSAVVAEARKDYFGENGSDPAYLSVSALPAEDFADDTGPIVYLVSASDSSDESEPVSALFDADGTRID